MLSWYYQRLHFAFWRRFYNWISHPSVLIIALHRITNQPVWEEQYNMPPADLDRLLHGLTEAGFTFVSLDQVFSGEPLPEKSICFTCDDGFADNLLSGVPIFRKYHVPYGIFIPTGFMSRRQVSLEAMAEFMRLHPDWVSPSVVPSRKKEHPEQALNEAIAPARNAPTLDGIIAAKEAFMKANHTDLRQEMDQLYLSEDQVKLLAEDPLCTLGVHGEHHAPMRRMNSEQLEENTLLCKQRLEAVTGKSCMYLAYPFGGFPDNYLREFQAADRAGFRGTLMFYAGIASQRIIREGHMVPRLDLSGFHTPEENIAICLKWWKES